MSKSIQEAPSSDPQNTPQRRAQDAAETPVKDAESTAEEVAEDTSQTPQKANQDAAEGTEKDAPRPVDDSSSDGQEDSEEETTSVDDSEKDAGKSKKKNYREARLRSRAQEAEQRAKIAEEKLARQQRSIADSFIEKYLYDKSDFYNTINFDDVLEDGVLNMDTFKDVLGDLEKKSKHYFRKTFRRAPGIPGLGSQITSTANTHNNDWKGVLDKFKDAGQI